MNLGKEGLIQKDYCNKGGYYCSKERELCERENNLTIISANISKAMQKGTLLSGGVNKARKNQVWGSEMNRW